MNTLIALTVSEKLFDVIVSLVCLFVAVYVVYNVVKGENLQ